MMLTNNGPKVVKMRCAPSEELIIVLTREKRRVQQLIVVGSKVQQKWSKEQQKWSEVQKKFCSEHTVQCTLYRVQCTLFTQHYAMLYIAMLCRTIPCQIKSAGKMVKKEWLCVHWCILICALLIVSLSDLQKKLSELIILIILCNDVFRCAI